MIRILSLGAGVQSSTLALMIAHGEIDPVQYAIFADTGAEPRKVYEWLQWLEGRLPFPVLRVSAGNLRDDLLASAADENVRVSNPPLFTEPKGMLRRSCTRDYKLVPIEKKARELVGAGRGEKRVLCEQLLGISWDESHRMKPARMAFMCNTYPLVDRHLTRGHCLEWMAQHGYPKPPKSACTFCPYHDDGMWRDLQLNDPESFADAVMVDNVIRNGIYGTKQALYLHRSRLPLDEVDFTTAEEAGQGRLFGDECEGMCGV